MESFEERVAAEQVAERLANDAATNMQAAMDAQLSAARSDALGFEPTAESAVAAVARLPLPPAYKATEYERKTIRNSSVLKAGSPFHQSVSIIEDYRKGRLSKNGTVQPQGWAFGISSARFSTAWLYVDVYPDGRASFRVRTPPLVGEQALPCSLREFCELGLIRWQKGTYKDSSWSEGSLSVGAALDEFVALAARLVAHQEG